MQNADDAVLIVSSTCIGVIPDILSSELVSIREWLSDNTLSLHLGKTGPILFGSKQKLHKHNTIQVQCAGSKLTCHTHAKYLGAKLDHSLSGNGMTECVIRKSNARLKVLYRQV